MQITTYLTGDFKDILKMTLMQYFKNFKVIIQFTLQKTTSEYFITKQCQNK